MWLSKFIHRTAMCLALGLALNAHAGTSLSITSQATPGLAGYTTYTLTAMSDVGAIVGFNFSGINDSGFGFYGPLNQVNPFGAPTIFNDNTCALCLPLLGDPAPEDSHFLVKSADGIALGALEGPATLQAAWNTINVAGATSTLPFAQIVTPDGQLVRYQGEFTIVTPSGSVLERVEGFVGVPEPAAWALALGGFLTLAVRGGTATRR